MTANAFVNRKENLARLVVEKFDGNRSALGRAAGVHQNQINLMLTDNEDHRRNMGEALARKMEESLNLPPNYFDQERRPSILGDVVNIKGSPLPEEYHGALRMEDELHALAVYSAWLLAAQGSISGPSNLVLCRVASKDVGPDVALGDHVVADLGVKAISTAGIYVIRHGSASMLRRVNVRLQGGWVVQEPDGSAIELSSLKGIKVIGRLVSVVKHKLL